MFSDSMMRPEGREGFRTPCLVTIEKEISNTSKTPCAGRSDLSRGRRFYVAEKRVVLFCNFSIYYQWTSQSWSCFFAGKALPRSVLM